MIDPLTLLTLFGPLVKDIGSGLTKKFIGDKAGKPANVDEAIKLMEAETKQLEARSKVGDAEGPTYPWVIAVIKLQRPLIVYLTLLSFLAMSIFDLGSLETQDNVALMVAVVVGWLFGERTLMKFKS
jgi:hypothetical protein